MTIKAVLRDDNGVSLAPLGTEVFVDQVALTTAQYTLQFPVDIKGLILQVSGEGTLIMTGLTNASMAFFNGEAITDATAGKVSIPCDGHGFADGSTVVIHGTTNYEGTEVLHADTSTDALVITATYVEETPPATAYAVGNRPASFSASDPPIRLDVAVPAYTTIAYLKASTTATVNILAWR